MNKKIIDLIKEKFYLRLKSKTSWGRNDLKREYDQAVNDALLEMLDKP